MLVNREIREYSGKARAWVGSYRNTSNLPHWHSDDELIIVEKGSLTIHLDDVTYKLSEGQCFYVAHNRMHFMKGSDGSLVSMLISDHDIIQNIVGNKTLLSPILTKDYRIKNFLSTIKKELQMCHYSELAALSVNNRIERLMIDILMNEPLAENSDKNNVMLERYKALLQDIDEKFSDYTIDDAASFCALSVSYFSKFFKRMADMTFTQYLNLVRVEKAIEMLRGGTDTITQISIDCGFGTVRNFNRVFKDITGFSPKELPDTYDFVGKHPTYNVEESFDPTLDEAELLPLADDE